MGYGGKLGHLGEAGSFGWLCVPCTYQYLCPLALVVVVLYIFIADFPLQLSQFI